MKSEKMRYWVISDDAETRDVKAATLAEAIEKGEDWVRGGDWGMDDAESSICLYFEVIEVDEAGEEIEDGEEGGGCVVIDPTEPECINRATEHDWQSPYDLLGGMEEEPGVWGGFAIEVCMHCGMMRLRDEVDDGYGDRMVATRYVNANEENLAYIAARTVDEETLAYIAAWTDDEDTLACIAKNVNANEETLACIAERTDDEDTLDYIAARTDDEDTLACIAARRDAE